MGWNEVPDFWYFGNALAIYRMCTRRISLQTCIPFESKRDTS